MCLRRVLDAVRLVLISDTCVLLQLAIVGADRCLHGRFDGTTGDSLLYTNVERQILKVHVENCARRLLREVFRGTVI